MLLWGGGRKRWVGGWVGGWRGDDARGFSQTITTTNNQHIRPTYHIPALLKRKDNDKRNNNRNHNKKKTK